MCFSWATVEWQRLRKSSLNGTQFGSRLECAKFYFEVSFGFAFWSAFLFLPVQYDLASRRPKASSYFSAVWFESWLCRCLVVILRYLSKTFQANDDMPEYEPRRLLSTVWRTHFPQSFFHTYLILCSPNLCRWQINLDWSLLHHLRTFFHILDLVSQWRLSDHIGKCVTWEQLYSFVCDLVSVRNQTVYMEESDQFKRDSHM